MLKKFAPFHLSPPYLWPLLLLIGANALIITSTPAALRYAAALILLAFLPGWVWLRAFFFSPAAGTEGNASPRLDLPEKVTLAVGFSLALTVCGAMFGVYLPGALDLSYLLIMMDMLILAGIFAVWSQYRQINLPIFQPSNLPTPRISILLILLITVLLLAAALRLPRLGYAELHEDEAEALMLGVRLMQGEDYALFLHRKGPAQMLVPLSFWLLTGQITEAMARFPFALSSILSVATLFFIGRRWFSTQAGIIAALLWAINGYAIAFGRMVQYQSLIFFLGPLGLYCLYLGAMEGWKAGKVEGWRAGRWLVLGAILLATCLLAHFDALLLLPAAVYLGWVALSGGAGSQGRKVARSQGRMFFPNVPLLIMAGVALLVFLVFLASFYVPYLLDPEFKNTASYLAGSRVKPGLLYNNLGLLSRLDKEYSSRFYLPLLAIGIISFLIGPWIKRWPKSGALPLKFGGEARAAWLMFGAGFIGYVFLVDDPRTHLYIMYPGAVLLAGAGFDFGFWILDFRFSRFRQVGLFLLVIWSGLIITYEGLIFLSTESGLDGLRQRWDVSGWKAVYEDLPQAREYFAYPKREGWKAIGALRAQGLFPGDFRSVNEDFIVPIWYNFGQARSCYDTPAQFFVRASGIDVYIPEQQIQKYGEVGWIEREGEVRLRVFSAGASLDTKPQVYSLEALAPAFDQMASPQHFIQQAEPSRPVVTQFGPAIQLRGFDLQSAAVAAGETLYVNLYWYALQPPGENYRAFVHLTDGSNLLAQQDDDPACRLPTSIWRAGQRSMGQFRLPIKPETPAGRYPLIIGLYRADTLERLHITGGAGQIGDDFLWLGDVEVSNK